jgi:hypothetical protein
MEPFVHQTAAGQTLSDRNMLQHKLEDFVWQGREGRHDQKRPGDVHTAAHRAAKQEPAAGVGKIKEVILPGKWL